MLVSAVRLVVVMMVGHTAETRMLHKLLVNKDNKRLVLTEEDLPVEVARVPEEVEEVVAADLLLVYIVIFVLVASRPIDVSNTQTEQSNTAINGSEMNVQSAKSAASVPKEKAANPVSNAQMDFVPSVATPPPLPALLLHQVPNALAIKKSVLTPSPSKPALMATGAIQYLAHRLTKRNPSVSTELVSPLPLLMDEKQTLPTAPPLVQMLMTVFVKPTTASFLKTESSLMVIPVVSNLLLPVSHQICP